MKSLTKHQQDVAEMRHQLLQLKDNHLKQQIFRLKTKKNPISNTTFNTDYFHWGHELGIEKLNSIIHIDKENFKALVEPRVSMEQLTLATLKEGVLVPVIPEFKGITVGGAINGAAIESSSHLYGQFNDICIAYEVLLGNGDLIRTTPTEYADLFYGLTGSYGSLGLIVSVELKLILASPWVKLKYHHFQNNSEAIACMNKLHTDQKPPEFIEGIVFSGNKRTIIEGRFSSAEQASIIKKTLSLKAPWNRWFYQHVKCKNLDEDISEEKIPLLEYLFRHDRGAFWMGAYALHWSLSIRYLMETQLGFINLAERLFGSRQFEHYYKHQNPHLGFRALLGYWMSSQRLYQLLHSSGEKWFAKRFVIQDYFIPIESAEKFIDITINETGIFPLWLCPVRATHTPQIFSPHFSSQMCSDKVGLSENESANRLLVDVGIYGIPHKTSSLRSSNQSLDRWALELKGRKMLYSYCYYSPEDFWNIYPIHVYEHLQQQYHAKDTWIPIYEKISQQSGE